MAADVTLADVAQAAGVSTATASRSLNGKDGVRSHVRNRVQLVADGLGYRPNRAAQNLAGGTASVIGLLLGSNEIGNDQYAAHLLQSFAKVADSRQEGLMIIGDSASPTLAVKNLRSDGLTGGLIVSVVAIGEKWVEELIDANIPTVMVGAHPRRPDVCVVDVENYESSATVVGHMLDTGCRRVATLTGHASRIDASLRVEGYRTAHLDRGLAIDESLIFEGNFTRLAGYERCDEILASNPDGVFCANDEMALGLHKALTERNIAVPGDISIVGFDGTAEGEFAGPELTTVMQPFDQMATTALDTVCALVRDQNPPLEQLITPQIYWGETTHH